MSIEKTIHLGKKQSPCFSRRSLIVAGGLLATSLVSPQIADAAPSYFKVGETTSGSSVDGYYQFSGHIELLVDLTNGSNSWTIFSCNRVCAVGSILMESWIQYGTDVVAFSRGVNNAGATDYLEAPLQTSQTSNMGGGVVAFSRTTLSQVSGGYLDYSPVGIDPYESRSLTAPQSVANGIRIPVLGLSGIRGWVKNEDLALPTFDSIGERLSYFDSHETLLIDVYSYEDNSVVDSFPIRQMGL